MNVWLYNRDCVEFLASTPPNWADSIVCDPPYALSFMGKSWDQFEVPAGVGAERDFKAGATGRAHSHGLATNKPLPFQEWCELWGAQALRVLKPGGHLVAFGGARTYHRLACALENVGFELRDSLMWMYGTGFPKSLNVSKAFDAQGGPEAIRRMQMGDDYKPSGRGRANYDHGGGSVMNGQPDFAPQSPLARQWDGWGTALKPAFEPIVLARKPLEGTVAANVAKWGTGALNIEACRLGRDSIDPSREGEQPRTSGVTSLRPSAGPRGGAPEGRWPANVLLDEEAGAALGTASRFFYSAKVFRAERDLGCEHLPQRTGGEATDREDGSAGTESPRAGAGRTGGSRNIHPTLKPVALMRYLVRLVTPPATNNPATGVVLDPFMGSGSCGIAALLEGMSYCGIEKDTENGYMQIAQARINAWERYKDL